MDVGRPTLLRRALQGNESRWSLALSMSCEPDASPSTDHVYAPISTTGGVIGTPARRVRLRNGSPCHGPPLLVSSYAGAVPSSRTVLSLGRADAIVARWLRQKRTTAAAKQTSAKYSPACVAKPSK